MPPAPEYKTWDGQPAIFAEDKNLMTVRMNRVLHPDAWSQRPLWETNHVVSNVVILEKTAKKATSGAFALPHDGAAARRRAAFRRLLPSSR